MCIHKTPTGCHSVGKKGNSNKQNVKPLNMYNKHVTNIYAKVIKHAFSTIITFSGRTNRIFLFCLLCVHLAHNSTHMYNYFTEIETWVSFTIYNYNFVLICALSLVNFKTHLTLGTTLTTFTTIKNFDDFTGN